MRRGQEQEDGGGIEQQRDDQNEGRIVASSVEPDLLDGIKQRAAARDEPPPVEGYKEAGTYFRLASVKSDESLATKVEPHQLEPRPPGLIAVTWPNSKVV